MLKVCCPEWKVSVTGKCHQKSFFSAHHVWSHVAAFGVWKASLKCASCVIPAEKVLLFKSLDCGEDNKCWLSLKKFEGSYDAWQVPSRCVYEKWNGGGVVWSSLETIPMCWNTMEAKGLSMTRRENLMEEELRRHHHYSPLRWAAAAQGGCRGSTQRPKRPPPICCLASCFLHKTGVSFTHSAYFNLFICHSRLNFFLIIFQNIPQP